MTAVLVVVGAMVGAPLRYLVDRAVQARHESVFPWGTLTVNVVGCLVLGGLTGAGSAVHALAGTGFCGALTTYSTFSYEIFRLVEEKDYFYATAYVAISVVAGAGAAMLSYFVLN